MKTFKDPIKLIRYIRNKTGLTQAKFGRIIKTGQVGVAKYELGINKVPGDKVLMLINYGLREGIL